MNSFTFYKNYFELIKYLNDKDRLELYDSIFNYMFEDIEPEFNNLKKGIWINLKMLLSTSKNNAGRGGRNKKEIKPIENRLETDKKPIENRLETDKKPINKQIYISSFYFLFSILNISILDNKDKIYKLLEEYLEIRIKKKYIVNETIVKRLINKLNEYGKTDEEKIKIIENAINGAWKDFYELKENKKEDKPKYQQVLENWLNKGDEENDQS